MSTYVFGVRITLQDYMAVVTQDATIGLYNVTSALASNAASGQADIVLTSATGFRAGDKIQISDSTPQSETGIISSIASNTITLSANLANTYTTAQSAKLDASSQFRWIQNTVSGVSNWNTDMLIKKSLGKIIKSADVERGGAVADIGGVSVKVKNVDKLWKDLDDQTLSLIGMRFEVVYFLDSTEYILFDGIINSYPKWDVKYYSISAAKPRNKRNALLSNELDTVNYNLDEGSSQIGKMIPVTFGEWKDKPAKFIRSADEVEKIGVGTAEIKLADNVKVAFLDVEIGKIRDAFPIVGDDGASPPLTYTVKLGTVSAWFDNNLAPLIRTGQYTLSYLIGGYIDVIEALTTSGDSTNTKRVIENAIVDFDADPTGSDIILTVSEYFPNDLGGNATATAANQCWINIVLIDREYTVDVQPCLGYLDNAGSSITKNLYLYSYIGEQKIVDTIIQTSPFSYRLLPQYGYIDTQSGNKNMLEISVSMFGTGIDQMDSFYIFPVTDVEFGAVSTWGSELTTCTYKIIDGFYGSQFTQPLYPANLSINNDSANILNVVDKDKTTYWNPVVTITGGAITEDIQVATVIQFSPPDIPSDLQFDNIYFGIRSHFTVTHDGAGRTIVHVVCPKWSRFIGAKNAIITQTYTGSSGDGVVMRDILDQYFTVSDTTKNQYFYIETDTDQRKYGYTIFGISETTVEEYNAIEKIGLYHYFFTGILAPDTIVSDIKVYELCVIFKKSISIKEEIYSYFRGRVYNDTWATRKTAALLMESPIDILEHACRMQNWSERGIMPSAGWGKAYSPSALINATKFDSTELDEVAGFKAARQILSKDEMYTENIKESLCRNFFLLNYQDKNGYECVIPLKKSTASPTNLITLADIRLADSEVTVEEANPAYIYPEPFVRFNYDIGAETYSGYIGVTNVTAEAPTSTQKEGYVKGFTGAEAVNLYDACVTLYKKSGIITKPPAEMTDLQWANGNNSNAEEIAKWYLLKWVNWMALKKVSFTVHFLHTSNGTNTREWELGQHFLLQLPHETNNAQIECICIKHEIDPNPPYHIGIEAIMLDSYETPFYIQEVMYTAAQGADLDVQETMSTSDTRIQEVS